MDYIKIPLLVFPVKNTNIRLKKRKIPLKYIQKIPQSFFPLKKYKNHPEKFKPKKKDLFFLKGKNDWGIFVFFRGRQKSLQKIQSLKDL